MAKASFIVPITNVTKLNNIPQELVDGLTGKITVTFVIEKKAESVARACGINRQEQANLEGQIATELAQILGMPI